MRSRESLSAGLCGICSALVGSISRFNWIAPLRLGAGSSSSAQGWIAPPQRLGAVREPPTCEKRLVSSTLNTYFVGHVLNNEPKRL